MLSRHQMQSSELSFELKKLSYQLLQELCPFSCFLSPSHRRCPVEFSWRTVVWDISSPFSFPSFWSKNPNHPTWRSSGFWERVVRTGPLSAAWRRSRLDTALSSSSPLPASLGFSCVSSPLSCSPSVQLYSSRSLACDWLVSHGLFSPVTFTQWCFGCSSGKRVSMFVLFCFYPH